MGIAPHLVVRRFAVALAVGLVATMVTEVPVAASPVEERLTVAPHRELSNRGAGAVGRWDVKVTIQTEPVQEVPLFCDLEADHRLRCVNQPGYPDLVGSGIWRSGRNGAFSFWITHHAERDENGEVVASINAQHLGVARGGRFVTSATTFIVPDDGSDWIGPIEVSSRGRRVQGR